jgi:uncharacterized protein (DUF58 family)
MFFSHGLARSWLRHAWQDGSSFAWFAMSTLLLWWGVTHVFRLPASGAGLSLMRHRVSLPRSGLVYLVMIIVILTGSLLGRSNMLMLVFALMAGPFIVNGWITFSMLRRIRVSRRVPSRVMVGENAAIEVTLENRRYLLPGWLMRVSDRVSNAKEELEAEVLFARVPRRGARIASYEVRLMQRGRYFFGPMQVSTRFPLGLVERGLIVPSHDEILVYPRLGRLSPRWKREHLLAAEMAHHHKLRRGVFDDEFHAIREYRSGDNPRNIHWRTSARQNQLMVREFHQSRDRNLLILLDLWQPAKPSRDDEDRVELAVSLAATLCVDQMKTNRDARFELAAAGHEFQRWEGRSGPAGVDSLLEMLALVMPGPVTDWPRLRELANNRPDSHTQSLLITTRDLSRAEAAVRDAWSAHNGDSGHQARVIETSPAAMAEFFDLG